MPIHWKLLFTVQSFIFLSAVWIRQVDVQNAQRRKKELVEEENNAVEGNGNVEESIVSSNVSKDFARDDVNR